MRQDIILPPSRCSLGGQLPEKELPSALQVKLYTRGKDILSRTDRTAAIGYMYFAN